MKAISDRSGIAFNKVKIAFDVTMVTVSLASCLIALHTPGSVGIGTVAAAILVGTVLGMITKRFGRWRDTLLGNHITPPA